MIIILKKNHKQNQVEALLARIKGSGVSAEYNESAGVISVSGARHLLDADALSASPAVDGVYRKGEQFFLCSKNDGQISSGVSFGNTVIGGGELAVIAGPCTVESEEQIFAVAKAVKEAGATVLRGGAYKPRTSPYAFQGLGNEGLKLLTAAAREVGLPTVSEILDVRHLDQFADIDVLQVGARNMHNYELLKELGRADKPVLLKRGMAATVEEWLLSAEYIMSEGNRRVILCERGIKTFEPSTRSTLDLSSIPYIKEKTKLPVIVDPSHSAGRSSCVAPLALAAVGAGADGVMVEVHNSPECALCDGAQALTREEFASLALCAKDVFSVVHPFLHEKGNL